MKKPITIKKTNEENSFVVSMKMTEGKILTLQSALHRYSRESQISAEMLEFLEIAMKEVGITPHTLAEFTMHTTFITNEKDS